MAGREQTTNGPQATAAPEPAPSSSTRKRVTKACDQCRDAKRKCDSLTPACSGCLSQGQTCTFERKTRHRGTQAGYVGALEAMMALLLQDGNPNRESVRAFLSHSNPGGVDGMSVFDAESMDHLRKNWRQDPLFESVTAALAVDGTPLRIDSNVRDVLPDADRDSSAEGRRHQRNESDEAPVPQWPIL